MTYRLIALDLDGTLLDSNLRIRNETIEALRSARARGVQAMIVTGRHHIAAYPYWYQLGLELPAICCNGAYMYDFKTRRPLANDPLTLTEARTLLNTVRRRKIYSMVYVQESMAYETKNAHLEKMLRWAAELPAHVRPRIDHVQSFEALIENAQSIWKFICAGHREELAPFVEEVRQTLGLACVWSGETRLDITRPDNSKGRRLAEWITERGISPEEVIAFGDEQNDIEMLRMAGRGIAMGNSGAEIKACADWVTGNNDSNGIAAALNRFVLTPA